MTALPLYPIELVIPQRAPMILIDEIVARTADALTAKVAVRADAPFFQEDLGMPSHVSLEWMAQVCAAYAGAEALDDGGAVRIGFLLGTRDFCACRPFFAQGARLYVTARVEYRDDEIANFACEVSDALSESVLVSARLNVYHPRDAAALVTAQTQLAT